MSGMIYEDREGVLLQDSTPKNITFRGPDGDVWLTLDSDGFHYKGQVVEDAGEAYRMFKNFLEGRTGDA